MKIVADENIPFVNELFGSFGDVNLRPGRQISAEDVRDAEILLVRSVTTVNRALLEGSRVRFVGTCTIGVDHLDMAYLREAGITVASAPGCNAGGVLQYALAAMAKRGLLSASPPSDLKVVVVGCGNVGGRIYRALAALGYRVEGVDPFLGTDTIAHLAGFSAVYDADVIFTHTPLTTDGPAPTHHLFDERVFDNLRSGAMLLNAGRGAVFDNPALARVLARRKDLHIVLDVWENEPDIDRELLQRVALATPHIAGYSYEGRVNGSLMIFDALDEWWRSQGLSATGAGDGVREEINRNRRTIEAGTLTEAVLATYDPGADDARLREAADGLPASFDPLRKHYPQRREFSFHDVVCTDADERRAMAHLGFNPVDDPGSLR